MGKFKNPITLKDPEPENTQNGFGGSVAIHNGYVVVGNENGKSPDTGSVHVFKKSGTGFSYLQTLAAPDGEDGDAFGNSVAIHDGYIVVGAHRDNDVSGSVYVYRLERGEFRHHQKIPNPEPQNNDVFGNSVAIHDGYIVVGANGDNGFSGSVYVYRLERGEFRHLQKIPNPEPQNNDVFGNSVAIHDGYIVVGAYYYDNNDSDSVYIYRLERGEFKHHQKIPNPDGSPDGDEFGSSVAISDGYIVVGAPGDNSSSGSVYVYRLERGEFRLLQKISNPDTASPDGDIFGWSVAIRDGYIVVGAYFDNVGSGSVYVYRFERGEFRHLQSIPNPDKGSPTNDDFGSSVAISDGRIVVGAPENNSTGSPGNAYIYSYGY